jgi:hypothetical protein
MSILFSNALAVMVMKTIFVKNSWFCCYKKAPLEALFIVRKTLFLQKCCNEQRD